MPECLKAAWPAWRLWCEGKATMTELTTTLSIDDVDRMCIAADYWFDIQHPRKGSS